MQERDWKNFVKIKQTAFDKFCTQSLQELSELINNSAEHPYDRLQLAQKFLKEKNTRMHQLFDAHSRNQATLQLLMIRNAGLLDEVLLSTLSKDLQENTKPQSWSDYCPD